MKLHNTKDNLIWEIFIIFIVFSILQKISAFEGIVLFGIEVRIILTLIMQILILVLLKREGNFSVNKAKNSEVFKDVFLQIIFHILLNISAIILINRIFSLSLNLNGTDAILNENSLSEFLCFNLSMIFFAPVIEELVFRDLIFNKFSKKYSIISSAIMSAILFGALHNKIQIAGAFLFGICMQFVYLKYSNILFPILIHIISNFISAIPSIYSFLVDEHYVKMSLVQRVIASVGQVEIDIVILSTAVFLSSSIYFYKFIKSGMININ